MWELCLAKQKEDECEQTKKAALLVAEELHPEDIALLKSVRTDFLVLDNTCPHHMAVTGVVSPKCSCGQTDCLAVRACG